MSDGLDSVIAETLAGGGDTGGFEPSTAPAPAPAQAPAPAPANTAPPAREEGQPSGFRWEDIKDPVALQGYKQLQAAFTQKAQEAAEAKRQLEEASARYAGVDEETLQSLQMLRTLQEHDPALAGSYLQTLADRMRALGGQAPGYPPPADPYGQAGYPAPDPYQEPYQDPAGYQQPYSGDQDLPPHVQRRLQALEQRTAQWEQQEAQRRFSEGMAAIQQEIGRPPTQGELLKVGRFLQDPRNQHHSVLDAYFVTHRSEWQKSLLQRGRDEALQVRQQAQAAPTAPHLAAPSAPPGEPADLKGWIQASIREVSAG